ncbi:MAG: lasso peptide biosynthesis B2 protein [Vicinamibacterales bacterium]
MRISRAHARAAEAAVAILITRVLLRLLAFRLVVRLFGVAPRPMGPVAIERTPQRRAANVARALSAASARLPIETTCLTRALAGRLMLGRRRIPSTVVLGVRRDDAQLQAHAWLAVADGIVCGEGEAPHYHPLAALHG